MDEPIEMHMMDGHQYAMGECPRFISPYSAALLIEYEMRHGINAKAWLREMEELE